MTERASKEPEAVAAGPRYLNGSTKMVIDVITKAVFVLVSLFVGVVAFEGKQLIRNVQVNSSEIHAIKSNRYTSNDALEDMRLVNKAVVELRSWIEMRYPPTWLKQDVEELKLEVRELRVQMLRRQIIPDK